MRYTITATNSQKLKKKIDRLPADLRTGLRKAVKASAGAVKAGARKRAPVLSGDLRRSIRYRVAPDGLTAVVKAHEYYGIFVEIGTTSAPAQPFMAPAAAVERPRFPGRISDDVRKALGL